MCWRCANYYFRYCKEKPVWEEEPGEWGGGGVLAGGVCKLSPETCGKCQTLAEQLKGKNLPISEYKVVRGKLKRR